VLAQQRLQPQLPGRSQCLPGVLGVLSLRHQHGVIVQLGGDGRLLRLVAAPEQSHNARTCGLPGTGGHGRDDRRRGRHDQDRRRIGHDILPLLHIPLHVVADMLPNPASPIPAPRWSNRR
jgi:hypothetical protein